MGFFWPSFKFFDSSANFQSEKFLKLAQKARKQMENWQRQKAGASINFDFLDIEISFGVLRPKDIWSFVSKLANFLSSGVDLKTAIGMLHKQSKPGRLRNILATFRTNLEYGLSLSETLRQFPKDFDSLTIALVEIGEKTGTLPKVLLELDRKLLETIELKKKIKGAMIYPAILVFMTIAMVIFMMTFIIPKIAETFIKAKVALPALTQFMINVSNFLREHFIILGVVIFVFVVIFKLAWRTRKWRIFYDAVALKIPIFGYIVRMSNVITFINSLSILLDSWILMLEALETTVNTVSNYHYKRDVARIKDEMEAGISLSSAMWLMVSNRESVFANDFFPEELVHMILVGEETGTIWKTIDRVWANYSKELRGYIGNLMTMLEPFILIFVGFLVGTIVIAIMLPFFNMGKVIQKS